MISCYIYGFDRVWRGGLLHKRKSYGISGHKVKSNIWPSFFFLNNRHIRVVLDVKSAQEYPGNADVPQGYVLGPTLFQLYINDHPDDVICDIAIYSDDTTLYSKCDQASDLWQLLEVASELKSDLRETVDWGRKWLVDSHVGKTQLVSFDRSNKSGAIDVKMDGSVLEEKSSFKMLVNWFNRFFFLILVEGLLVFFKRLHDFSVSIPRCYKDVSVNSFFSRAARFWNSLSIECFPLTYDLNGFKSRINRHLFTVGSFWTSFMYALIFFCFFFL